MVELFVEGVGRRVVGYSRAVSGSHISPDRVLADDRAAEEVGRCLARGEALYYVDGALTGSCPNTDGGLFDRMAALGREAVDAQNRVDAGARIFMENVMGGMALGDAQEASRADREALGGIRERMGAMEGEYGEMSCQAADMLFSREEEGLEPRHFLSMVAVVRDEDGYLEEWVRYHIEEMGFGHFYIYDNESRVPVREYLEGIGFQYLDRVTVIPWGTTRWTQQDAYSDFLEKYSHDTKWFLAADPDEYVVLKDGSRTLTGFLGENGQYATIKCLWKHYNANGQAEKTPGTDMGRFTQATGWEGWKHGGKKFAQSNRIARFQSYVPIERRGARVLDWGDAAAAGFFQLNHYFTRSWEEWKQKIQRGSSNPGYRRRLSMFFELNPDMAYLDTGEDLEQGYGPAGEGGDGKGVGMEGCGTVGQERQD